MHLSADSCKWDSLARLDLSPLTLKEMHKRTLVSARCKKTRSALDICPGLLNWKLGFFFLRSFFSPKLFRHLAPPCFPSASIIHVQLLLRLFPLNLIRFFHH